MNTKQLINELIFQANRSSGAGGQHVNKVSSKIELRLDIANSSAFSKEEKKIILLKLKNKINNDNILILTSQESRSQHKNKELVIQKLLLILKKTLIKPKTRKKTKPSKTVKEKRLEKKAKHALKKANRKKIRF
jgi:ribosome-associated protein